MMHNPDRKLCQRQLLKWLNSQHMINHVELTRPKYVLIGNLLAACLTGHFKELSKLSGGHQDMLQFAVYFSS